MSSAEPGNGAATATATDDRQQALLEDITAKLGDDVVGSHIRAGDLWVRVRPEAWVRAAEVCKAMGFDYFGYLSGIDWMPHTWPNPKVVEGADGESAGPDDAGVPEDPGVVDTEGEDEASEASPPEAQAGFESDEPTDPAAGIVTGVAGGDTRFQVIARLYSTVRHIGVHLKADLDDDNPRIQTWTGVYAGADWCERETWEMYGFTFDGHPNLTHLYLPGEFEGFPLRKDFPLLAREVKPWPGLVDVEQFPASYQGDD